MGGSSTTEDMLKTVAQDIMNKKAQPQQPPPDYEGMKLQIQGQKNQVDAQLKSKELDIKEMKVQMEAQAKSFEHQLLATKEVADQKLKQFQAMLDQALVGIEQQRVEIQGFQAQAQVIESEREEARLAKETSLAALSKVQEFLTSKPDATKMQSIAPVLLRRAIKLNRDETGNIMGFDTEELRGTSGGEN
jgi:hypothetical protein